MFLVQRPFWLARQATAATRWNWMQQCGFKLSVKDIKKEMVVSTRNKLWLVKDFSLHTQGRQGSHYKVDLIPFGAGHGGGGKITERFNPDESLEGVELAVKTCRFLYESEGVIRFLDQETYEEVEVDVDLVEGGERGLKMITEDMDVVVQCLEEDPSQIVSVKLPLTAVYKIKHADPAASIVSNEGKGTRFKQAILENDVTVVVPEFVNTGELIIVTTADAKYKSRAK
ncbi:hypothetical protein BCR33DRAFT_722106 [Rhizoclosmatium globosum]|uniref:Translation elongation factor P n=1 Tax=Rhizoclosmatium globosum TaxID=329046 RepID=A0A1Y2BNL1_9FUNG|nr:hypothetical protein BCR33DRAFT_722106 [Rhizoclosmatium globosum]|eukprot:ORY36302.1 hypothetical protein BCR33DRAFT_722106 [Rhizoclosmatium globosum]